MSAISSNLHLSFCSGDEVPVSCETPQIAGLSGVAVFSMCRCACLDASPLQRLGDLRPQPTLNSIAGVDDFPHSLLNMRFKMGPEEPGLPMRCYLLLIFFTDSRLLQSARSISTHLRQRIYVLRSSRRADAARREIWLKHAA
jgi:hypothetical protein